MPETVDESVPTARQMVALGLCVRGSRLLRLPPDGGCLVVSPRGGLITKVSPPARSAVEACVALGWLAAAAGSADLTITAAGRRTYHGYK